MGPTRVSRGNAIAFPSRRGIVFERGLQDVVIIRVVHYIRVDLSVEARSISSISGSKMKLL